MFVFDGNFINSLKLIFLTAVMENGGEDQLGLLCEKWRSITCSEGGKEYST